jgi:hypothetical protein
MMIEYGENDHLLIPLNDPEKKSLTLYDRVGNPFVPVFDSNRSLFFLDQKLT